ncbi:MAG: hypothetical protein WD607_00415, partial [Candidatus Paceibacterota bacterium]
IVKPKKQRKDILTTMGKMWRMKRNLNQNPCKKKRTLRTKKKEKPPVLYQVDSLQFLQLKIFYIV